MSELTELVVPVGYVPRPYQLDLWNYMDCGEEPAYRKRAACVWHRRAGKDLTSCAIIAAEAMKRVGTYWHLFPTLAQGRDIIWEGLTGDGKKFTDVFGPAKGGIIESRNSTDMRIRFKNGSNYRVVGADKFESRLVGTNPVGIVISEWSVMDPALWLFLQPILTENKGWAIFIFTPRGENHAYDDFQRYARDDDRFAQLLTVDDTNYMSAEDLEDAREEIIAMGEGEGFFQQEYYCGFHQPVPGNIFGDLMDQADATGRIGNVPYDPMLPCYGAWDLGLNDSMVCWVYQKYRREVRMIDYITGENEGMEAYMHKLNTRGYKFERHYGPHDLRKRDYWAAASTRDVARDMGHDFQVIPKLSKREGHQAVRTILPRCYFDKTNCRNGIQALKAYRREKDTKTREWKDEPVHDWASHGADAFRILALATKGVKEQDTIRNKKKRKRVTSSYEHFTHRKSRKRLRA